MSKDQVHSLLARYRPFVEAGLGRALEASGAGGLTSLLEYHLGITSSAGKATFGSGGKLLRGTLCLLAAEAVGGETVDASPAAAALELLHGFTLLHDDIADQDEVRRGRPTVWKVWGVGQAITAGDAMFALANLTLGTLHASTDTLVNVLLALNEATLKVCEGQHLDLAYEGREHLEVEDYLKMISLKTAALFAAAPAIGAEVGGGGQGQIEALGRFGYELGMAFQIRDDLLGLWGEASALGKKVGADLLRNKRSLPILLALSLEHPVRERLRAALAAGVREEDAAALAAELEAAGVRVRCEERARAYVTRAVAALEGIPLCEEPAADLRLVAAYLAERER